MLLHLPVQRDSTHQLDVLFLHAVAIEHLQECLDHDLTHIRFFRGREGLAVIVKQDEHFRIAVDEFA